MYKSSSAKLYWKGTKKGCKKELAKGIKILVNEKAKKSQNMVVKEIKSSSRWKKNVGRVYRKLF